MSAEREMCAARQQGTAGGNDPVDCDWPLCGCDGHADQVIVALIEAGWESPDRHAAALLAEREACAKVAEQFERHGGMAAQFGGQIARHIRDRSRTKE